jgi:hypothetical protein
MNEGFYPPRGVKDYLIDNLSELPTNATIVDFNEFYRLFQSEDGNKYIYRVKHPKSALNMVTKLENDLQS